MTEPPDSTPTPEEEDDAREAIREQLADLRREVSELAGCEGRLAAAAHRRELRRWAVDVAGPAAVALALLTAFGLANAAAARGAVGGAVRLGRSARPRRGWAVVAGLLALGIWMRGEHGRGLRWWRALTGTPEQALEDVRRARDRAEQEVRATLERLVPALSAQAATAVVPVASAVASGMATGMAGGVVDVGGDLIEGSDDLVESITESVPGGGIVNQIWDVVLGPGRFGVRVATTVLQRSPPSDTG